MNSEDPGRVFDPDVQTAAPGFFRLGVDLSCKMAFALNQEMPDFQVAEFFAGDWIGGRDDHVCLLQLLPLSSIATTCSKCRLAISIGKA